MPITSVYFVRHAQPNCKNHDDRTRELTAKGLADRALVTAFFRDIPVDAVLSSPFRRASDTVAPLAAARGLAVELVEDFRERQVDSGWIDDFDGFARRQWADFHYRLPDGECLDQVQRRNTAALECVLARFPGKTLVIGSHGTALCTLIHRYQPAFGYGDFCRIRGLMPWVVRFTFDGGTCLAIRSWDVFTGAEWNIM